MQGLRFVLATSTWHQSTDSGTRGGAAGVWPRAPGLCSKDAGPCEMGGSVSVPAVIREDWSEYTPGGQGSA